MSKLNVPKVDLTPKRPNFNMQINNTNDVAVEEPPKKENEPVKVERVVDTKLQEENERLKKQAERIKEESKKKEEEYKDQLQEQEQKIKQLEERKPAGRPKQYEAEQFTKYSLNIRKEFLLYMQTYAQATRKGQVALVFDDAIKKFINSVSKEDTEAIKYALRKQGKDYDSLFNNLIKG